MRIEIQSSNANFSVSGSQILRGLQNQQTPLLDLLVRESIQNSLDAATEKTKTVSVKFITGTFERETLNAEFEDLQTKLDKAYPEEAYKFLAIKDVDTVGLTGPLSKSEVADNKWGNLIKLVYEFGKPQTKEGSGGSWGIGKSIYYRLGLAGIVIFYSQIENEKGQCESRLVACQIEDETSNYCLIPKKSGEQSKSGIALWGLKVGKSKTQPITDKGSIKAFLKIFGIDPYADRETGTMIIIPYLDEESVLNSNQPTTDDNSKSSWRLNFNKYLDLAIQKWYSPRLNNSYYRDAFGKPFLKAYVNGKKVKSEEEMIPFLWLMQSLSTRARFGGNDKVPQGYNDFFTYNSLAEPVIEPISLANVFKNKSIAGWLAYTKVSTKALGMCPPDNKPSPFRYLEIKPDSEVGYSPLLAYCRLPGMNVSFVSEGKWLNGVPCTNDNEIIFAQFVLNSEQVLNTRSSISLEEYIRSLEQSDHLNWFDTSIDGQTLDIVKNIQRNVANKLKNAFSSSEVQQKESVDIYLGKTIGKLILPTKTLSNDKAKRSNVLKGCAVIRKNYKYRLSGSKYTTNGITLFYHLETDSICDKIMVRLNLSSESGNIDKLQWEKDFDGAFPVKITDAKLTSDMVSGEEIDENTNLNLTSNTIEIVNIQKRKLDLDLQIDLKVNGKDFQPNLIFV